MRLLLALFGLAASCAPAVAAQSALSGVRLVGARTEPASPGFGTVADLEVEFRIAPGFALFVADTLAPTTEMAGVGRGTWTTTAGPADSLTVRASYRVVGFRAGIQELPRLELGAASRGSPAAPAEVLPMSAISDASAAELRTALVPLGSTTIAAYAPIEDAAPDAVLAPRPPADVAGGEWSVWLILAVGLASVAGAGGLGAILPRWWSERGATLLARWRGHSPKQDALRELDRIRSLGWHRDGRLEDFYASSSDTLREFAARIDPELSRALTLSELVARLEHRWGPSRVERLYGSLAMAERVKFGTLRPDPEAAEGDWSAMRDWIRTLPDE